MPVARSGRRLTLSAFLACVMLLCGVPTPPAAPAAGGVRPGIEVFLAEVPDALRGKRVGLITNNTGIDRSGTSDIDLIAQSDDLTLVALLAPEHGIRGTAEAGVTVADGVDAKTGLPVFSLYAAQRHSPTRSRQGCRGTTSRLEQVVSAPAGIGARLAAPHRHAVDHRIDRL